MFAHTLGDDGLELRLLLPEHAEKLFAVVDANREHLRPWLPWVDESKSPADTLAFIKRMLGALAAEDGFATGIFLGGDPVGSIGMHNLSRKDGRAEIGYWLSKEHEGRGYMTRATRAIVHYGFGDLGLHRVAIKADTGNVRSRAVPERLGFTLEGIERGTVLSADGSRADHAVYSLLATDSRSS